MKKIPLLLGAVSLALLGTSCAGCGQQKKSDDDDWKRGEDGRSEKRNNGNGRRCPRSSYSANEDAATEEAPIAEVPASDENEAVAEKKTSDAVEAEKTTVERAEQNAVEKPKLAQKKETPLLESHE